MRNLIWCAMGSIALLFWTAAHLSAQDGANLYTSLCASCHEGANERAPNRVALQAMSAERVLGAMESGAMVSMASGRSTSDRRAIAEFLSGRSLGDALNTTPPVQARCSLAGDFANPLAGPVCNGWGVDTSNTRYLNGPGPAIAGGMLFVNSGYAANGIPGNVFLAFSVDGK